MADVQYKLTQINFLLKLIGISSLFLFCLSILSISSFCWAENQDAEQALPNYAVQAGLYVGPIQANRLADQLTSMGYSAWLEERTNKNRTLYYVLVGPFVEVEPAQAAINHIKRTMGIDPFIIDLNNR